MKEMTDQTRMIVFVVLVVAITFIWSHFFTPAVPPASQQKPAIVSGQTAPAQSGSTQVPLAASVVAGSATPAAPTTVQASAEKLIDIDSPLYHVQISNRGGVVRSWKLKKYLDDQTPAHPLELVNQDAAQQLGSPFSLLLSDAQLQGQANTALYEVTPADENVSAPATVTLHWSDGHMDVTKKLTFGADYELSVEVSATLDGKPLQPALAWRGGFGDRAVYKAAQLVTVFYKQGDKLNLLQYKKLGVSGNQSQPAEQAGPLQFGGIEDQFFAAAFIPDGTDLSLWHWTQDHAANGASEPEAEMAVGPASPGPMKARLYVGPKDLASTRQGTAFARRAGAIRVVRGHLQAVASGSAMGASLRTELGLGDCGFHGRADDAAAADSDLDVPLRAEDATRCAGDQVDPGSLQEIFDERSSQAQNERGSDGGVPAGRDQSGGKLPADAGTVPNLDCVLPDVAGIDRIAARAVDRLGPRSFGQGSVLYFADCHGDLVLLDDEDDADAGDYRSGATENDAADACVHGFYFLQSFERFEPLLLHVEFGQRRAAVVLEPHSPASFAE